MPQQDSRRDNGQFASAGSDGSTLVVHWDEEKMQAYAGDAPSKTMPLEADLRSELLALFSDELASLYYQDSRLNQMPLDEHPAATECTAENQSLACQGIALSDPGLVVNFEHPTDMDRVINMSFERPTVMSVLGGRPGNPVPLPVGQRYPFSITPALISRVALDRHADMQTSLVAVADVGDVTPISLIPPDARGGKEHKWD